MNNVKWKKNKKKIKKDDRNYTNITEHILTQTTL